MNQFGARWLENADQGLDGRVFVVLIAKLTSPGVFEKPRFRENLAAIAELDATTRCAGRSFHVAMLPILIDLRGESFRPIYDGITARLEELGIHSFDLSATVRGLHDSDLWMLPIDQHPNEVASALFAERLRQLFQASELLSPPVG
jgi:hypothetical protein